MTSPDMEQFSIRQGELEARARLVSSQFDPTSPIKSLEEKRIYNLGKSVGEAYADHDWAIALVTAMAAGEITPRLALKLWDLKDQASRNFRDMV